MSLDSKKWGFEDRVLERICSSKHIRSITDHDQAVSLTSKVDTCIDDDVVQNALSFERMKLPLRRVGNGYASVDDLYDGDELITPMAPSIVRGIADSGATNLAFACASTAAPTSSSLDTSSTCVCLALSPSVRKSDDSKRDLNALVYLIYRLVLDDTFSLDPNDYGDDKWTLVARDSVFKSLGETKIYGNICGVTTATLFDSDPQKGKYAFRCRLADEKKDMMSECSKPSVVVSLA